jgi:hypothetical protein
MSGKNMDADDVTMLAAEVVGNEVLTKLGMSGNKLNGAEAGKALAGLVSTNTVLKELDLSGCDMQIFSTKEFCVGLSDNGAISVVNILANDISKEQAEDLIKIMKSKASLKSLCGITPDQREADFSGQMLNGVDAMLITNDISDNGALSKLVVRQNNIHNAEAGKAFSNMLAQNTVLKELDLSSQKVGEYGYPLDPAFVKEFAVGISDNSALLQLDISDHVLSTEKERAIAKLCDAKGIRLTLEAAMPSAFGGGSDY